MEMVGSLVCPTPEIIQWVADTMREQQHSSVEERERLWDSVKLQIDRISRVDDRMYDDKLAGEILQEKYEAKHAAFGEQKAELQKQLSSIDKSFGNRLDQTLVLLELSQKAAEIYAQRTPQQKTLDNNQAFQRYNFR